VVQNLPKYDVEAVWFPTAFCELHWPHFAVLHDNLPMHLQARLVLLRLLMKSAGVVVGRRPRQKRHDKRLMDPSRRQAKTMISAGRSEVAWPLSTVPGSQHFSQDYQNGQQDAQV
jgi:hypothetical protein